MVRAIASPDAKDLSEKTTMPSTSYGTIVPDLVLHVESSLKSMRTLWQAANLTDEQLRIVFERVMAD